MISLNLSYSYTELTGEMKKLQKEFPMEIALKSIGISHEGREIPMLILGKGQRCTVVTGGVHGRENINPVVLIKMAQDYAEKLKSCQSLKKEKVFLVPLLNPDGYEIARSKDAQWKNNARNVDINRNFPSASWESKWPGDFPGSEAETQAFMNLCLEISPQGYIDYHSRGNSIFYYRKAMDRLYNQKQKQLAMALASVSGYTLMEPQGEIDENDSGGNTVHFFSEVLRKPAITIETAGDEEAFPLRTALQGEVYENIKDTLYVFLDEL